MAKLVIVVDIPDALPTTEDPHEAAADILYHYEAHRETNQDERDVRFVVAMWGEIALAQFPSNSAMTRVVEFELGEPEPEPEPERLGIAGMSQGKRDDMLIELEMDRQQDAQEDADEAWGRSD